jgi:CBS domain-containing protein
MNYTDRQLRVIEIIKDNEPIRSKDIADMVGVSQATVRQDLSILVAVGVVDAKPNVGYSYSDVEQKSDFYHKLSSILVKDIMSNPVTVEEDASVYDGTVTIILEDTGTLFVTKDGYLTGVVSRKDLLRSALQSNDLREVPIGVIMTRLPLVTCSQDSTIGDAALLINDAKIDSVPVVVDEEGKLKVVGRLSKTTITEKFVEML